MYGLDPKAKGIELVRFYGWLVEQYGIDNPAGQLTVSEAREFYDEYKSSG